MDILKQLQADFHKDKMQYEFLKKLYRPVLQEINEIHQRIKGVALMAHELRNTIDRQQYQFKDVAYQALCEQLREDFPKFNIEVTGPAGLRNQYWFRFVGFPSNEKDFHITFHSPTLHIPNTDEPVIHFDTGEVSDEYPRDSIGAANGMNNVSVPLESYKQLESLINTEIGKQVVLAKNDKT